ncbi:hypothetical protein VHEMI06643 [[Torrubiella] hemipterigena]|uniref:Uncharacterized protein n=1 Tax=[Torrubiella] hemipterigena TaxID=1531966 RepID=A0A0A1TJL1_9HYPO|nr:hypothetical protein VHEMI06643 [[Torrubiella] hemipterigena]
MMEEKADDCFPERLARDLELRTDVFMAQKMTAGAPASAITAEYMFRQKTARALASRPRASSPYYTASARIRSLGAIEERDPSLLITQDPTAMVDTASEVDSTVGSEASGGMPPPSFRYRNQSIATAATSLDSSTWKPSPPSSPEPTPAAIESSWINCDSDDDDEPETMRRQQATDLFPDGRSQASLRSLTVPQQFKPIVRKSLPITASCADTGRSPFVHKKSHSVSGGSPMGIPRRSLSCASAQAPRGSAAQYRRAQTPDIVSPIETRARASSPALRRYEAHEDDLMDSAAQVYDRMQSTAYRPVPPRPLAIQTNVAPEVTHLDDGYLSDLEAMSTAEQGVLPLSHQNLHARPSISPSHAPSVQSWLNSSVQGCPISTNNGDDMAKIVPLPPDVVETLRVSTTCFPETMLLSSSLTIETIRSYAKKVRHPVMKPLDITPPTSPTYVEKKSLWRKVVSHRRGDSASISSKPTLTSASMLSVEAIKPWASLRNVFNHCSDYICDAMYAHIVAYNYISALAAKLPQNDTPSIRRNGSILRNESQQEDIPKKAASLLGLGGGGDQLHNKVGRLTKKISSQMTPWMREDISIPSNMNPSQESSIRNIQADLFKCIAQLVATAKLAGTSNATDDVIVEVAVEDADTFLIRSLCEIVRMAEDAN